MLSGTWDFKWCPGSTLRIAFQKLPADIVDLDFELAKNLVISKLTAWLGGSYKVAAPNLDFRIVEDLPAPPRAPAEGLRSAKSVAGKGAFVEYDALISFLPLPVVMPATEQHDEQLVGTSSSELGRYAQRIEYGVPTAYLGPQPGAKDDWFESDEGIFTITHEIGHILGLPHEHQNPNARDLVWKPMDVMEKIVRNRGGLARGMSIRNFIESEVVWRWPAEIQFSDWRAPPAAPEFAFDSVMAKPSYRCLLQNGHDGHDCTGDKNCKYETDAIARLKNPTVSDLEHLLTMYGKRPDSEPPGANAPPTPKKPTPKKPTPKKPTAKKRSKSK